MLAQSYDVAEKGYVIMQHPIRGVVTVHEVLDVLSYAD
jgi:hypothetical protein